MIRRSPEIEAIVMRWTRLIRLHEVADIPHFLSRDESLLYIGTSHEEIWRDRILRDGIADHLAEVPDITEDDIEVEAWENGETGWAFYKCRFGVPATGASGVHRLTCVFVMERGGWKMVQHHLSQPDSNIEKLGMEHQALNALVDAARDGFRLEQSEGMASVMFTDIADSTALAAALGDRTWAGVVAEHLNMVGAVIAGQGGTLVKSLGDGTMSSFPTARAALEAAVEVQRRVATRDRDPALGLRVAVHTGDVVRTDDDFFGTVVNKAARLTSAAQPGEILASDATRLMAGSAPGLIFGEPVMAELRGLDGTHVHYRLDWS